MKIKKWFRRWLAIAYALASIGNQSDAGLVAYGPMNSAGFPAWFQDQTGLKLDFGLVLSQNELDKGYMLITSSNLPFGTAPERYPDNFARDHYYWYCRGVINYTTLSGGPATAELLMAVKSTYPSNIVAGQETVYGMVQVRMSYLPYRGTYTFVTPFDNIVLLNQPAGSTMVRAEMPELSAILDDSRIGPFLLPSETPGGTELPPIYSEGNLYIADPARVGPVTGSVMPAYVSPVDGSTNDPNVFRIEGPNGFVIETRNFSLAGRRPANTPPTVAQTTNQIILAKVPFSLRLQAKDNHVPALPLSWTLGSTPPSGLTLTSDGWISWTPLKNQAPQNYTICAIVSDNGSPAMMATNTFTITVLENNTPPTVASVADQTVIEGNLLQIQLEATAEEPSLTLRWSLCPLLPAPEGVSITPEGLLSWTPNESQGPGDYLIDVIVTDSHSVPLSTLNEIRVSVLESNSAPVIAATPCQYVAPGKTLSLNLQGSDSDVPDNLLTWNLAGGPEGMTMFNGTISWTPTTGQCPSTNPVTVVVSDDGSPSLSATNSFQVVVMKSPTLSIQPKSVVYPAGQNGHLYVRADGGSPISYQWYKITGGKTNAVQDDWRIAGSRRAHLWMRPGSCKDTGTYYCIASNAVGTVTSARAGLSVLKDAVKPTLVIQRPANGAVTPNPAVKVAGITSDNVRVAFVQTSVNLSAWSHTTGTNNWSSFVSLQKGLNLIDVRSVDLDGNVAFSRIKVTRK